MLASTKLFKIASGSLKLSKMNMISGIFYYMLVFNLLGGSLIYIGLRDHYLIQKISSLETIDKAYYALAYTSIAFPVTLIIIKKVIWKLIRKRTINSFIRCEIVYSQNMKSMQGYIIALVMICTLATIYVFAKLGYTPITAIFNGEDINALRQSGNRFFSGNQYIKNLLMYVLTPFVSYMVYIYFRISKLNFWKIVYIYMAILSVIVLTYDFSKAPIITYLLGIYMIEVMLGNVTNNQRFKKLIVSAGAIIIFFYIVLMGADRSVIMSVYSGPVGRVLFTQIATLFLHFDAFPAKHAFLQGASFNGWMSLLIPNASGDRSGRVVMTIYNAQGVESNTAGVMNTIFVGEAYANYGLVGIIIAPIIFGVIIGIIAYLLPSLRKTPALILIYVQLSLQFINIVEGGFVDIFYSASILFLIIVTFSFSIFSGKGHNIYISKLTRQCIFK